MAFEFYDPRRPAQELLEEVVDVVRDTIGATEERTLREIRLELGDVMASDEVERVVVFTAALPAADYDDPDLAASRRLWKGWRIFFDEALRRTQPLWAGYVTADLPPNLTELRDPEIWEDKELSDIWVCAELAPALRGLPYRACRTEEVAGGLWVSAVESLLRGKEYTYEDRKHDGALVRAALLPATEHLLPARDPKRTPRELRPVAETPTEAVVQVQLWKSGTSAVQLYGDIGVALLELGGRPVEAHAWEEVLPLPDGDAVEVELPREMPGVVVLEALSEVVLDGGGEGSAAREALRLWLAEVVRASGAHYGALRFDQPYPPPVAWDGEVVEGPYSFAVDRSWLGSRVLRKVEKKLDGAWRRDVGDVTVWWVRPGDGLVVGQFDRALAAATLIAARARR